MNIQEIPYLKRLLFMLILISIYSGLKSQNDFKVYKTVTIHEVNRTIQLGQILIPGYKIMVDGTGKLFYEKDGISGDKMTKAKPANMIIRLSDLSGMKVKDITIDFNDVDIDLSQFGLKYLNDRKFIIIGVGRYCFTILNLINDKIIGPLSPKVEGKRGDSQDGSVYINMVFNNGQYLIGYSYGMGLFCYNLMDLYNPIQVESFSSENSSINGNCFFLDKRKDNLYNGLVAKMPGINKVDSVYFLFQGLRLEADGNGMPIRKFVNNRCLILFELQESGYSIPIIIDYKFGKVIRDNAIWIGNSRINSRNRPKILPDHKIQTISSLITPSHSRTKSAPNAIAGV
jgi:hypothetical protein